MLRISSLASNELKQIQQACCYIFLDERPMLCDEIHVYNRSIIRNGFIESLNENQLKDAYLKNVASYHPDKHRHDSEYMRRMLDEHIRNVNQSYDLLSQYLDGYWPDIHYKYNRRGKVIAIAGGQEDAGSSIFAANLAMLLSMRGHSTALVDMNGKATRMPTYLGTPERVPMPIAQFLNPPQRRLRAVVRPGAMRPQYTYIDQHDHFLKSLPLRSRKRLINRIRELKLDYCIIDLGTDSSNFKLDFFLSANYGILLCKPGPEADRAVYNYIHRGLQRKLRHLFGEGSSFAARDDTRLREIIFEATGTEDIPGMLKTIKSEQPLNLPPVASQILDYKPNLIINQVATLKDADSLRNQLRDVTRRKLAVELFCPGHISHYPSIQNSTNHLCHPIVAKHQGKQLIKELTPIISKLEIMQ